MKDDANPSALFEHARHLIAEAQEVVRQAVHATEMARAVVQERRDVRTARIKSQMMSKRHAAALVRGLEATSRELDGLMTRIDAAQKQALKSRPLPNRKR